MRRHPSRRQARSRPKDKGKKGCFQKRASKKGLASSSMSYSLPGIFNGAAPTVAALGIQNGKKERYRAWFGARP
jgi:hypothetical protein